METAKPAAGPLTAAGPTPRARLARLAREAALADPGVVGLSAGPGGQWIAADRDRDADVVAPVAARRGADAGEPLATVGEPIPPLHELADAIRERIAAGAKAEGLANELGAVDVSIADVASPEPEPAGPTAEVAP